MNKIEALKDQYGPFLSESSGVDFSSEDVPVDLRELIPYASFWGLSDDLKREILIEKAPGHVKATLRKLIADKDDALDVWLGGEEASNPNPSDAYVAFSAMRMAADYM